MVIPERVQLLEKAKDVFLSWYSTRIAIVMQSESVDEELANIKYKYKKLDRITGIFMNND